MNDILPAQRWASAHNLVPLPYRRVSVQPYSGPMTVDAIAALLLSREAYRRTDFIVLRGEESKYAVVAITRAESEPLFSPITSVEGLALPETCIVRLGLNVPAISWTTARETLADWFNL